jgi:hypothetical protein
LERVLKKSTPGKAHIIWGAILFMVPFFSSGTVVLNQNSGEPEFMPTEWIRWIGIGLIVYGFMKNSSDSKG